MFSGLIEAVGRIEALDRTGPAARLQVAVPGWQPGRDVGVGDSIAVDGVCLTATRVDAGSFHADLGPETLRVTTLGHKAVGEQVNLERALRLGDRLGGHLVSGHVDGVGRLQYVETVGDGRFLTFAAPPEVLRYVIAKGSIAVDGISLTVVDRRADSFRVMIIPHTLASTTLARKRVGAAVNLEADLIAKHVEALATPYLTRSEDDRWRTLLGGWKHDAR